MEALECLVSIHNFKVFLKKHLVSTSSLHQVRKVWMNGLLIYVHISCVRTDISKRWHCNENEMQDSNMCGNVNKPILYEKNAFNAIKQF